MGNSSIVLGTNLFKYSINTLTEVIKMNSQKENEKPNPSQLWEILKFENE